VVTFRETAFTIAYSPQIVSPMQSPHIKTSLPGPKAASMLKRDALVVSPSYPRDYPFVMSHGKGAQVWDVDGNRFLDFAAGIAVCSTGHSHPVVVQAIKDAADQFLHISSDYWHERQIALAEKLNALNPMGEPAMSFFCQSGTEAVEGALKLARYVSGRSRFIGFLEQIHAAERLLPDDAGCHACTVSQCISATAGWRGSGRGGAELHRERALRRQRPVQ